MKISVLSNIGLRRTSNQDYADYFTNKHQQALFVLCDGVGGNQAGDVASRLTTQFIGDAFSNIEEKLEIDNSKVWIDKIINKVNTYIFDESRTAANLEGMSTTLVMVLRLDKHLIISHVGDSRAYIFSNGKLVQMTEDHSLVNELIRSGEITAEEGEHHPIRNVVTQSIGGTPTVSYEVSIQDIEAESILLLCSDGLTNMVSLQELTDYFVNKVDNNKVFSQSLIDAANQAGGMDNITVVLVSELENSTVEEVVEND